jgi:polar amino acid transport system substrate-binding protein
MIKRAFGIILLCLSIPVPCEAAELVRAAHNSLLPPFAEVKNGKSVGLVIDIFRAAAERAGYSVEFLPVPIEQMELALTDGRALAVIPTAITPERRQRLDFSATLLMTGGSLYVRAPDPTPESLRALAGKTVVTPRTGPLAAFIQKTAPEVKLVVTEDYETSLARLASGEADAAALNYQTGALLAARLYPGKVTVPRTMFLELPFGAAVLKGQNAEFLTKLNTGLAAIRADGTWDRINKSWMGQ